jgi:uncharacterized protein YecE (DUF72 family)
VGGKRTSFGAEYGRDLYRHRGWSYKAWEKRFYLPDLARSRQLEFYISQFPTVEINATFYRLPAIKMVQGWRDKAADFFIYAIKGSRFITHLKRLTNLNGALTKFLERIQPLNEKIGCLLWQLPPNLQKDYTRLDEFLRQLPQNYRHAVEFRHPSWLQDDIFDLLQDHSVAHASISSQRMPMNLAVTAQHVYLRFHGLAGGAAHDYTRQELEPWAEHIRDYYSRGKIVFVYFNNDINVRAPDNAKLLMEMTQTVAV